MVRHARQHLLADIKRTRYKWLVHHARALGVEPDPMTVEVLRDVGTSGTGIDAAQQSAFDGWRNWVLNMYEGDNSSAVTVAERQPTLMPLCRAMMIRE